MDGTQRMYARQGEEMLGGNGELDGKRKVNRTYHTDFWLILWSTLRILAAAAAVVDVDADCQIEGSAHTADGYWNPAVWVCCLLGVFAATALPFQHHRCVSRLQLAVH